MPVSETEDTAIAAEPAKKAKKKHSAGYYAATFFAKTACTVLALWLLFTFVAGVYICRSNSSFPMVKDGDLCITYRLGKPKQGDLLVYKRDGDIRFGRLIAFGGDEVGISEDTVTVNGYAVYDDTVYPTNADGAKISFPYTIPENCVFVLNDFRTDSTNDSRTYGGIPLGDVKGKVVFVMRRRGI